MTTIVTGPAVGSICNSCYMFSIIIVFAAVFVIFCERRASCSFESGDPKIATYCAPFQLSCVANYVPAASFSTQSVIQLFTFVLTVEVTHVLVLIIKKLVPHFFLHVQQPLSVL